MDNKGRIPIPLHERKKLGLKAGTEFELFQENGALVLRLITPDPLPVDSRIAGGARKRSLLERRRLGSSSAGDLLNDKSRKESSLLLR